ncbi:MAG: HAD hydrolase family protein [Bacteroidota bacterium]|nr:HAD hydrolase family protein [Bacteroidota bacterium]
MKNLNGIKLFISDIDGVWTDGGMYYDQQGNEWKKFSTSDGTGVLFLQLLHIPLAIITGEKTEIVQRRAQKLKIPLVYQGVQNKLKVALEICQLKNITLDQIAYIGDDLIDLNLLLKVGLSAAPLNAPEYVKQKVDWVIPVHGGNGAFRAFVEKYLTEIGKMEYALDQALKMYSLE